MDSVQLKVQETLTHIKSNIFCNSKGLDSLLVKDLHDQGLVEGNMSREVTRTAPIFYDLRITLTGEQYLEALTSPNEFNWRSSPIIIGFISFIGTIAAAGVIYYLGLK